MQDVLRMSLRSWGTALGLILLLTGCGSDPSSRLARVDRLTVPAAPGSGQPRLVAKEGGTVWMSWVEPANGGGHALRYATLSDSAWTAPRTVTRGTDWFVNWADLPSVRPLPDGRIAAHVLESSGPSALAYDVRILQTTEAGDWQEPMTPHRDSTQTEHGFASMLPWSKDQLLAVWLDGRRMTGHGEGEMMLRSAIVGPSGTVQRRFVLDDRTCECCATSAVRVGSEALVAYRDRSADEIRNIRLVRFDGEEWSEPQLLHDDGWRIEGCPVNGPALSAQGDRIVATWFTAAGGTPRVKAAFSTDGGQHFSPPIVVTTGQTQGRVDAVLLPNGSAVVSWLGQEEGRGVVRARVVRPDGSLGAPLTVARLPTAARRVGFPKMVRHGGRLVVAWVGTDGEKGTTVRSARISLRGRR